MATLDQHRPGDEQRDSGNFLFATLTYFISYCDKLHLACSILLRQKVRQPLNMRGVQRGNTIIGIIGNLMTNATYHDVASCASVERTSRSLQCFHLCTQKMRKMHCTLSKLESYPGLPKNGL
uniref:Uncharacterized protein n=1 Tax=viral metagenome TaxID=1070528 RepID=A0A6C0BZB6_9ZZZZ